MLFSWGHNINLLEETSTSLFNCCQNSGHYVNNVIIKRNSFQLILLNWDEKLAQPVEVNVHQLILMNQ